MKGFAIAVIAVMVCSAFAITVADDDSSAADGATEYKFQVQMNDGTNSYFVQGSHSGESFAVALKATLDDKGLTYDIADSGWVNSITANGVTYASGTWGSEPYYGFAIYYLDGKEWKTTVTYDEGSTFAVVFDQYLFTAPSDASKYLDSGFGYWTLLPSAVSGYSFQIQLNDGTNKSFAMGDCNSISFANALMEVLDDVNATYSISASGWVSSITVDGVTYAPGTWGSEPYYGFAIYYLDGKEWKATATYNESDTFAVVFDKYLFTEPTGDDASKYCNSGFGYWTLLPSALTEYSFQIQMNDGTNSCSIKGTYDSNNFAYALMGLLDDVNATYSISPSGWVTSITVDGVTYASGTWGSEPYYGFAIYYLDGKEWKATATYNESDTFAIVFDKYLFTEPTGDDASKYCNSGFGYWTLLPESVSDDDGNSNILIYVGAAILAIIAIAVIVFAVKKSGCS